MFSAVHRTFSVETSTCASTRARTGISEWLLGSVAKTVLSCAPCPVLTLRGDELGAHPPQERDQTLFGGR